MFSVPFELFKRINFFLNFVHLFFGCEFIYIYIDMFRKSLHVTYFFFSLRDFFLIDLFVSFFTGIIIILTGLIGLYATLKEHRCVMKIFVVLILTCLFSQVALYVIYYTSIISFKEKISKIVVAKYDESSIDHQGHIQMIQQHNNCCGVFGWKDYNLKISEIPNSCCQKYSTPIDSPNENNNYHYDFQNGNCTLYELKKAKGCKGAFFLITRRLIDFDIESRVFYIISIGSFVNQILSLILSLIFIKKMGESKKSTPMKSEPHWQGKL